MGEWGQCCQGLLGPCYGPAHIPAPQRILCFGSSEKEGLSSHGSQVMGLRFEPGSVMPEDFPPHHVAPGLWRAALRARAPLSPQILKKMFGRRCRRGALSCQTRFCLCEFPVTVVQPAALPPIQASGAGGHSLIPRQGWEKWG